MDVPLGGIGKDGDAAPESFVDGRSG